MRSLGGSTLEKIIDREAIPFPYGSLLLGPLKKYRPVQCKNVAYFFKYGVIISLLLSKNKLILKEYDVNVFWGIESLKF